jgi:hypothetical protein
MKKNIRKIKAFFAKRNNAEINLNDMGMKFVLCEGELFDTEVEVLTSDGVETDGYGDKSWDELEASDIAYIASLIRNPEFTKQLLIDDVIEAIKNDLADGDATVLAELLTYIPEKNLKASLPEWDLPEVRKIKI